MFYFGSLTKEIKTPGFPGKYFNFPENPGAQKPREIPELKNPGKSRENGRKS